jgi:hypothetical protein
VLLALLSLTAIPGAGSVVVQPGVPQEGALNMNTIPDGAAGLTLALTRRALAVRFDDLPDDIRVIARQCVLDTLAVAIAGAGEPLVRMLEAELVDQGGAGTAGVIGRDLTLPALSAALLNGTASHALDLDDVAMAMPGHPSATVLPAVLALAEERGASGAELIAAFVAGTETACRIGRLVAPGHYDGLGFHATGTIGTFGAAMGCAHLLGLDVERTAHALGIAASQAAGLKAMFGTMCKPLHAGRAAYNGLLAARLAARGFTSRPDALECPQGFARTHSPDFDPAAALAEPAGGWHLRNNLFKYHAACYFTHAHRGGAQVASRARADRRPDRRHHRAGGGKLRPGLQYCRPPDGARGEIQPPPDRRHGHRRPRYRAARHLFRCGLRQPHPGAPARPHRHRIPTGLAANPGGSRAAPARRDPPCRRA